MVLIIKHNNNKNNIYNNKYKTNYKLIIYINNIIKNNNNSL